MVYTIRPSSEEWRADFMRVLRRFISERRARRSGVKDNVGIVSARLDSMRAGSMGAGVGVGVVVTRLREMRETIRSSIFMGDLDWSREPLN